MMKLICYNHNRGICLRAANPALKRIAESEDEFLNRIAIRAGLKPGEFKLVAAADIPGNRDHRNAWELHLTEKKVAVNAAKAAAIDASLAEALANRIPPMAP